MVISHWVIMNSEATARDNTLLQATPLAEPEDLYRSLQCNYLKFFKMDKLCKWAWIGAECLLTNSNNTTGKPDPNKVAIVLGTTHGCIDVDKRYNESLPMASPALFVYTLPNIMLGEICIRQGFKGEQLCTVNEEFDIPGLCFSVQDIMTHNDMDACLCGWVDVTEDRHDVCLFWVTKEKDGLPFTPAIMQQLYQWKDFRQ